MTKKYTYTGSQPLNATINFQKLSVVDNVEKKSVEPIDLKLSKGDITELPEDNKHVKSLVANGLLIEVTETNFKK